MSSNSLQEDLEVGEVKVLTRRDVLVNAFMGGSLLAGFTLLGWYVLQFLLPSVMVQPRRKIFIATTDMIGPGKSYKVKDLKGADITVTNTGDGFIALSTKCTHLGCQVHWKPEEKVFYCPCHNGYFDAQGKVLSGPPPRPLDSYRVEVIGKAIYIHVDEVYRGIA